MPLFLLLLILAFLVAIARLPIVKGKIGEYFVARALRKLNPKDYCVLNNVTIPDGEGGTTQIDHIVLSPYRIFVIETKNMKGWIFGNAKSAKWTQQIYRFKTQFQNPFRQNYKHIVCLSTLTKVPMEAFEHVVVFVGEAIIKTPEKLPPSLLQGTSRLLKYIRSFTDEILYREDMAEIASRIVEGKLDNTFKNSRAHVKYVKGVVAAKTEVKEMRERLPQAEMFAIPSSSGAPMCPKCGVAMVRRESKRGERKGDIFWGCPNFPKCRQVVKD